MRTNFPLNAAKTGVPVAPSAGSAALHVVVEECSALVSGRYRSDAGTLVFAGETGLMHGLVDCACGAVVYREVAAARVPAEVLLGYVLFYNALAFGLQWILGWLSDLRGAYRWVAAAGPWLVAAGVLLGMAFPWSGAALAGVGNACFHVGVAGALLPACGGRAFEAGVFVGPGAIGIFVGVWMGAHLFGWELPVALLLGAAGIRLWFLVPRGIQFPTPSTRPVAVQWIPAIVAALFFSVMIRSVVAGVLNSEWRSSVGAGLTLAIGACCGKCLGGWLADRYGWRRTGTVALVLAAPLVFGGMRYLPFATCAMLLVQSTMPATLAGTYAVMPPWPGLAFGLPSLALLLGTLPGFVPWLQLHQPLPRWSLIPVILVSAVLLWLGLNQRQRRSAQGESARSHQPDRGGLNEPLLQPCRIVTAIGRNQQHKV